MQEKVADFGYLERYFVRDKVRTEVERAKELEWTEKALKQQKRALNVSR